MSFVIYDLETTGLTKGFDQIVQVAAVYTDENLNIKEPYQARCRLMPHVIPSPEALYITGSRIEDLIDPGLPSHYEMIVQMRHVFESWCPALFLGFNSISFDEEFLRQAFYQSLFDAYLTNTEKSARADVLSLCRMTAALRPDVLVPGRDGGGAPIFKLAPLAEANGIEVPVAHEAMADVMTTLALCRHIKEADPDIWSQFVRFGQKTSVEAFIKGEDAFVFSETIGNQCTPRVVTRIGQHTNQKIRHYCLDLCADFDALRSMSDEDLAGHCRSSDRPIITIRSNTAPTLWALSDARPEHLEPFSHEDEVLKLVTELRADQAFLQRLLKAAQAAEIEYPPSPYVEEQLYSGSFAPPEDKERMRRFHIADWVERAKLVEGFVDDRYRRLAQRLVYFERPDLLKPSARYAIEKEIGRRILTPAHEEVRWRSIPRALSELETLLHSELVGYARAPLDGFAAFLSTRQGTIPSLTTA